MGSSRRTTLLHRRVPLIDKTAGTKIDLQETTCIDAEGERWLKERENNKLLLIMR